MSFEMLSEVDRATKSTVYGWIRQAEQQLRMDNIPTVIGSICIRYYRDHEIFYLTAKDVTLSKNNKCMTKTNDDEATCSYGITKLPSNCDNAYRWQLKINEFDKHGGIRVGVSIVRQLGNFWAVIRKHERAFYLYSATGSKRHPINGFWGAHGKSYKGGDIISIILDLKKREIKYLMNHEDQGIAYPNIPKDNDINYQLVVSMAAKYDSVEIVNFSKC